MPRCEVVMARFKPGFPENEEHRPGGGNCGAGSTLCSSSPSSRKVPSPDLSQLVTKSRTIKQRLLNRDIFDHFNEGHEDDLFKGKRVQWRNRLLSGSQNTSSEDEYEAGRSRSPAFWSSCASLVRRPVPETHRAERSPSPVLRTRWQEASFLQRMLAESTNSRVRKRTGIQAPAVRRKWTFGELSSRLKEATVDVAGEDLEDSLVESYFEDSS